MLPPTPTNSHSFPPTSIFSHPPPPIPIHSHPLLLTPIHFHLLLTSPTYSHAFLAHSYPLPLMFGPLLLDLSPLPPMYSLSYPFPVHIKILSPNLTHHLPFQPIFSPCVLRAFVFYVLRRLCTFVFHVPMCQRNSFLCNLLPMSIYFTCFCVLILQDYLFTLHFLKRYL